MSGFFAGIAAWFQAGWTRLSDQFYTAFIEDNRWKYVVQGLGNTLKLTFFALLVGLAIGIVVAIVRSVWDKNGRLMRKGPGRAALGFLNGIFQVYLTVVRGTPVVIQIMIIYYIIMGSSSNKLLAGVVAFGINSGAYVAEIIRAGIMSIDQGQTEAGRSLGLSFTQTMWNIVLPQAFKNVLPPLANEFIVLLKETAVAGYVATVDLTMAVNMIRGVTYQAFMPLVGAALIYLSIFLIFTWLIGILERRLRASER